MNGAARAKRKKLVERRKARREIEFILRNASMNRGEAKRFAAKVIRSEDLHHAFLAANEGGLLIPFLELQNDIKLPPFIRFTPMGTTSVRAMLDGLRTRSVQ